MITLDEYSIDYMPGDEDYIQFVSKWNKHSKVKQNRNRLYSWFHSIKSNERKWLMINGSHLTQAFDVHACNFCILGKLLENTQVDKVQLKKYQNIMRFDYIYSKIAQKANIEFTQKNKRLIKQSCQHWLNIRKRYINTGKNTDKYFDIVDSYFKEQFPTIYNTIVNWREENYTDSKGNTKISKMLWDDFQKVQLQIITGKMCTYLHKKYGVIPVTVHDALYLSIEDMEKITENIENLFWNMIDYQYLYYTDNTDNIDNPAKNAKYSNNVNLENTANTAIVNDIPYTITGEVDVDKLLTELNEVKL